MGASVLLAGATGCAYQPAESIVPYVVQPPGVNPGDVNYYATAVPSCGYAMGALATSHEVGRRTFRGTPSTPASLGACDPFMTASILDLYDPDRSQAVMHNGRASTWDVFLAAWNARREMLEETKGRGFHILTGAVTSASLARLLLDFQTSYPEAVWHAHEPTQGGGREGTRMALGQHAETRWNLEQADVIVALDADFLSWGPGRLAYARQFASRRDALSRAEGGMNRLHVAEPAVTITGGMADHRLPCRAGQVPDLARAIAAGVLGRPAPSELEAVETAWVARVVSDLKAHRGRSVVMAGEPQPPEVHALALSINAELGNLDATVMRIGPVAVHEDQRGRSIAALAGEMAAGRVSTLLMLGTNPVYDAPTDLEFARALAKMNRRHGHDDPPWRARGRNRQALALAPARSSLPGDLGRPRSVRRHRDDPAAPDPAALRREVGDRALGHAPGPRGFLGPHARPRDLGADPALSRVRRRRRLRGDLASIGPFWIRARLEGPSRRRQTEAARRSARRHPGLAPRPRAWSSVFRPDPTIWDGRHSNNGWLQELPKPVTKLTWDNAARMAKRTAERLGVVNGQVVVLQYKGKSLRAAAWIDPGHHEGSVMLSLGYGRTNAGRVGSGQGFNAYALRTSDAPWGGPGLSVVATPATYPLANTQHHQVMEGRDIVRAATLDDFLNHPDFAKPHRDPAKEGLTLYEEYKYDGHKWGMSINLNTCIGCNACVTACQSENNSAVVGKDQVLAGRDLHWIRVDRYYTGEPDAPEAIYHQPVPCMQCENAPCEVVCPVNATVHDAEGLNVMVYNRCVGTRYCSNNCPYKVRRFNFLAYGENPPESLKLMYNPEVSIRTRGVMEKCSYCVQRIVNGRVRADQEGRPLKDGEVVTACQSACPTRAIVFGDLNDKQAEVVQKKADPRDYALLAELNTRPRTTYLAKITNPAEGSNDG